MGPVTECAACGAPNLVSAVACDKCSAPLATRVAAPAAATTNAGHATAAAIIMAALAAPTLLFALAPWTQLVGLPSAASGAGLVLGWILPRASAKSAALGALVAGLALLVGSIVQRQGDAAAYAGVYSFFSLGPSALAAAVARNALASFPAASMD